ncbi:MAG: RluA family pseudouridine synthase [Bacteroidetes bacterium]|nr:RluA family pseudouridine synthase [Bacteroidota bacterium]
MKNWLHYENNWCLIVNKPFGVLSQKDQKGEEGVFEMVKTYLGEDHFVDMIQRLDRTTGGLMLFAKTPEAAKHFHHLQSNGQLQKTYLAVTENQPETEKGTLTNYLKKLHNPTRMRAFDEKVAGCKKAVLDFEVLAAKDEKALLKINPKTGRMHQIRVQLAKIGCPIVGDKKYGKTQFLADQSIALFSKGIEFQHPKKKETMRFEAEIPEHEIFNLFK